MAGHICQFGVTHKTCRCPKVHQISCDRPEEHKDTNNYEPKHRKD